MENEIHFIDLYLIAEIEVKTQQQKSNGYNDRYDYIYSISFHKKIKLLNIKGNTSQGYGTIYMLISQDLVPPKNITSINLVRHIVQAAVIAVGYDRVALGLERCEVVHNTAAEEGRAVLQ